MVSTLFSRNNMNGSVAQLVEQRGHNPLVGFESLRCYFEAVKRCVLRLLFFLARIILKLFLQFFKKTVGFRAEIVARDGVRARTTAAADESIFAGTANSVVVVGILKKCEHRILLIRIHNRNFREFSAFDRQKAGRENRTIMRNEHNSSSIRDSQRCTTRMRPSIHARRKLRMRAVFRRRQRISTLFQHETPIKWRLRRFHTEQFRLCVLPQLFETYDLFRLDSLFSTPLPTGTRKKTDHIAIPLFSRRSAIWSIC